MFPTLNLRKFRFFVNKYLIARDVKFSGTNTEAMIKLSFPTEDYSIDQDETKIIKTLGKRSNTDLEAEVAFNAIQKCAEVRHPRQWESIKEPIVTNVGRNGTKDQM